MNEAQHFLSSGLGSLAAEKCVLGAIEVMKSEGAACRQMQMIKM